MWRNHNDRFNQSVPINLHHIRIDWISAAKHSLFHFIPSLDILQMFLKFTGPHGSSGVSHVSPHHLMVRYIIKSTVVHLGNFPMELSSTGVKTLIWRMCVSLPFWWLASTAIWIMKVLIGSLVRWNKTKQNFNVFGNPHMVNTNTQYRQRIQIFQIKVFYGHTEYVP